MGTDIAFLGALINHVLQGDHWFREYVVAYTNASTLVDEDYEDSEDLDGVFVGWDPETRSYDPSALGLRGHAACRPPPASASRPRAARAASAPTARTAPA